MQQAQNPFIFGRVLQASELIDRVDELALLKLRLMQGGRLFLIGPRRFGKTSLLTAAAEQANKSGTPTLLINAERFTSLESLAGGLIAASSTLLEPTVRDRLLSITKWFAYLKPQAEYDALTDTIKVTVAPKESQPSDQSLAQALDTLNKIAGERDQRIAVIIDEFQVIHALGGVDAERALRASVQEHANLSYIFAGSDTRMLMAMINEHRRPFYRLGDALYLGPVPRKAFGDFIRGAFATVNRTISEEALELIFDLSEDVPYNTQRLAGELWDKSSAVSESDIKIELINEALKSLLSRAHANYLSLYLTLTTTQRKIISGMAKLDTLNGQVAKASRRIKVAASSYRAAQKSFLDSDLLHERFDGMATERQKSFVDPFFKLWLANFVQG